jgi:tRNA G46 methylase TrmB
MLNRISLTEQAIQKFENKDSISEIGCATGYILLYYARKFGFNKSYGVEIDSSGEDKITENGISLLSWK